MKLNGIDIDGFGVLTDTSLADFDPHLSVVYGSNGSGKTTLMHFLRGVFCGFDHGRKIGLLPPTSGRTGGGALRIQWDGDVCRFARHDEPASDDRLRVTLLRNDLESTHPRFDGTGLRTDLVPLLYTVGAADVHAVDGLVRQAMRDGIQLETQRENPERFNTAATHVHNERTHLLRDDDSGQVSELAEQRQRMQANLHQLTEELRLRVKQWESQRDDRPSGDVSRWARKVDWLRSELAAVDIDLHEAEDRQWMPQPPARKMTFTVTPTMPSLTHLGHQRHEHIDVHRVFRLKALDRRIDHDRALLAEAARARLDVNLRAARIAGSDDTSPGPFIKQVRESLAQLEAGILDLRDDAETLHRLHDQGKCVCGKWQSESKETVTELSKRLYRLCEQVSRYELRHQKSIFSGAHTTLDDCELSLLTHLEGLRQQRRDIIDAAGQLGEWKGTVQSKIEHDHCDCLEHEPRLDWRLKPRSVAPPVVKPVQTVRVFERVIQRPSNEEMSRLRRHRHGLQSELDAALVEWRQRYHWRPSFDLPEDIIALERQIDEARIELNRIEDALANSQERWRVLSVTGEVIRRVVEKIEQDRRPTVIQWASQYLQRLTGGRYTDVVVTPGDLHLEIIDADGIAKPRHVLSRGTLDQLALSLRLALTRAYASRGVRFPLLLDDVLVDTDLERLHAAVTLLQEFSVEHDQQIIYLTCQTHLADLFERSGSPVRQMPGSSARRHQRLAAGAERSGFGIRGWVDRRVGNEVRPSEPTTIERVVDLPETSSDVDRERTVTAFERESFNVGTSRVEDDKRALESKNVRVLKPLNRRQPDGSYWLSMDAAIDLVPSIGSQMGRRLAGLGVRTVIDLIDLDADDLSLRLESLQITSDRLRDWQAEAELLCCVPDLTGPDAQMIVLCRIYDADQLSRADLDWLMRQIDELSDAQHERMGYASRPSRDFVQRWMHSARRSRSLHDARRFSRSHGRSSQGERSSSGRSSSSGSSSSRSSSSRTRRSRRSTSRRSTRRKSSRESQNRETQERERYERETRERETRERETRERETRERDSMIRPFVTANRTTSDGAKETEWKFYLGPEDPVVDAPSIGPTTAKRLEKIGVITVSDLLNRDAGDIAERLNNRRVKAETVLVWQQQARLCCRIPLLRGHDAQVLVACSILEPEHVAGQSPDALFAIIGPFVSTKEGQRLLRSAKTPDLEEVTDWINWARHARQLRAA